MDANVPERAKTKKRISRCRRIHNCRLAHCSSSEIGLNAFEARTWVPKTVLLMLGLGFPLAVFFAWAFELTPEGIMKEWDVDRSKSITPQTGQKLDRKIIAVLDSVVVLSGSSFNTRWNYSKKQSRSIPLMRHL